MSERRLLALLALLIGLLAAFLLFLGLLPRRNEALDVEFLRRIAVDAVLGLIALVGSVLIWGRQYRAGGIINVVMGIVVLILASLTSGLLLVFSGILGLVAAGTFDEYRYRR